MHTLELPGNPALAARLRAAATRGTLSHALLFSGQGDWGQLTRFAAAAFVCSAEGQRPCGVCGNCRKVLAGIHPDVITAEDKEHKNLGVDVIRRLRSDAWIRPNEAARKVYLFDDCAILTEPDQNTLLKVVEEGPPYAAFVFCAAQAEALLPTLRSRCVELKLQPPSEAAAPLSEPARRLCEHVCLHRGVAAVELLVRMEKEKPSREEVAQLLEALRETFVAALAIVCGAAGAASAPEMAEPLAKNLTKAQIMRTIEVLQALCRDCAYYVSAGQVLGALAVELEGIL